MPGRRDKILSAIAAAEARRKAIAVLYAQPGFFERTLKGELQALEREDVDLGKKIEGWMSEWEGIESELAALGLA